MEKILTFIIKDNKLLLLLGSANDPQFHESFWYTVTGSVEENETLIKTVIREVKEETNLELNKIIDLNLVLNYESLGINCNEHVFVSYTDNDNIILNEESIDYKWCRIDEFIELIKWYYDKQELESILSKYIK